MLTLLHSDMFICAKQVRVSCGMARPLEIACKVDSVSHLSEHLYVVQAGPFLLHMIGHFRVALGLSVWFCEGSISRHSFIWIITGTVRHLDWFFLFIYHAFTEGFI